ncbi:MAG: hypothetical protein R3F21_00385 [Myxococcota bacterium]
MGHVVRSGVLAAAAHARGWRVRVFLAGDRVAEAHWRSSCPEACVSPWSAWRASASAPLTLFDQPFPKSRWLAACRADRTRAIVLDDPRPTPDARLTIHPGLHHLPNERSPHDADPDDDPASPTLTGPRYSILAPVHRETIHRPLADRDALLLSIGGADPHQITPRIAPILLRALAAHPSANALRRRIVVLGPAYHDPCGQIAADLAAGGWQVERALAPAAMARRMADARLAVMGFGTSLSELAWHGTPHLSVTHQPLDSPWAQRLEAHGIGAWLGDARALDPDFVAARFTRALGDEAWQGASAARARAALEGGRGCERILDRLALIARELDAPASRRSGMREARPGLS